MLPLAMLGAHVLIDQLPVLKNAGTNVTVEAMIFAAPIAGTFVVRLLVVPQSRRATETCLASLALVGLFTRVQINMVTQVTFSFERYVAYFTNMLGKGRMKQHVLLEVDNQMATLWAFPSTGFVDRVVLVLERLLNFSRNQLDRSVRRV